jgi:hypothetical protein
METKKRVIGIVARHGIVIAVVGLLAMGVLTGGALGSEVDHWGLDSEVDHWGLD